jgi:EmrB/QacA subfamily drug resistance transporter
MNQRTIEAAEPVAPAGPVTSTVPPPGIPRQQDAPPAAPPAPPAGPANAGSGWLLPMSVLIVGTFMSVLDTSITNVAIPRMQVDLSAAPDDVAWVVTGFTLALGIVVPVSGWLGERLGQARLYMISMLGFALASALCGMAWSLSSMIAFRVLQAVPGAILPVVSLTLLYQVVPPAKIGSAMGIYGLGVVVAPAVGPVLGGWLVEYVDWRLIFYINVPIGVLGTAAAIAVFPRTKPTSWPRFDLWGFVAVGYGLFALLLACSEGQNWGWDGYRIRGLLVSGVLSLALFVVIELEVDNPLIDLRVFTNWAYTNSIILLGIAVTGLFAVLYFLPLYLQQVQGLQALDAGLVLVPSAAILVILMPLAGRLYDIMGPRWPVVVGLTIMAYGSFLMAHMTPDTPRSDIIVWTTVRNLGVGLAMMPIFASGLSALPVTLTGSGSSMNNVMQRVASSLAVAVFSSLGISATAQLISDRGGLLAANAAGMPEVAADQQQGASGMVGIYQAMSASVQTQTYNNGYYIVGILCAIGIPFALTLRHGKPKTTGGPVHIEM